jgi:hypothetical protein
VSRASRVKGDRIERQIVALHTALGVKAERVPLSGAVRYQGNGGDLDIYAFGQAAAPFVGEVKARGNGEGFATLERWLGDSDVLFLRRDRAEPIIVLPLRIWARLLSATTRKPLPAPWRGCHQPGRMIRRSPSRPVCRPLRARWWPMMGERSG